MSAITYIPEPEPFMSQVMLSKAMEAVVMAPAKAIESKARALAPVHTGRYLASIKRSADRGQAFRHGPRVVAVVEAGYYVAASPTGERGLNVGALVEARYGVMAKAIGR